MMNVDQTQSVETMLTVNNSSGKIFFIELIQFAWCKHSLKKSVSRSSSLTATSLCGMGKGEVAIAMERTNVRDRKTAHISAIASSHNLS